MKKPEQSIWYNPQTDRVQIIDQRWLPHRLCIETIYTTDEMCQAIRDMHLRGAPLIGVTAAYGVYLACRQILRSQAGQKQIEEQLQEAVRELRATQPTAVNLDWALDRQLEALHKIVNNYFMGKPGPFEAIFTYFSKSRIIKLL